MKTKNDPYAALRYKEFNTFFANKKNGKWLFAFDGVYYIRDQKLNTEMKLE